VGPAEQEGLLELVEPVARSDDLGRQTNDLGLQVAEALMPL
jgi:hypothetical protein